MVEIVGVTFQGLGFKMKDQRLRVLRFELRVQDVLWVNLKADAAAGQRIEGAIDDQACRVLEHDVAQARHLRMNEIRECCIGRVSVQDFSHLIHI